MVDEAYFMTFKTSFQIYQKFTKGVYLNQCQVTLKISFKNLDVALDKVPVHSNA